MKNILQLFLIGFMCCFNTIYSQQYNELDPVSIPSKGGGVTSKPDCEGCIVIPKNRVEYFKWRSGVTIVNPSGVVFSSIRNQLDAQYQNDLVQAVREQKRINELVNSVQNNVYKVEIEERIQKLKYVTYSNFNNAIIEYLANFWLVGRNDITRQPINHFKNSKDDAKAELNRDFIENESGLSRITGNMYLIRQREAEIKSNNLFNSRLGNAKIGNKFLKDVRSLGEISNMWQEARHHFSNYKEGSGKGKARLNALANLKTDVYAKRMLNDYNTKSVEERFNIMDEYLGWSTPRPWQVGDPGIPSRIPWYIIDKDHLLADAKKNAVLPREVQIFDKDYLYGINRGPYQHSFLHGIKQEQDRVINAAIANLNKEDALAVNLVNTLSANAKKYINARPALKTEIETYFKVNNFSKVSHDCVNYLLNQLLGGKDFTPNTSLYKSATTPLLQNRQNPNRALEWRLGTQAVREGFTNFGNVLSELLKGDVDSSYEGRIIRDMFGANGVSVPPEIDNKLLGDYFHFQQTAGDRILINHSRGHGTKENLNTYLRDLREFDDLVQDLINNPPPIGSSNFVYINYENRIAEALTFTNDADASLVAGLFQTDAARDAYLNQVHHQAIAQCGLNILREGFSQQLEFKKLNPEGIEFIAKEATQVATIEEVAEEIDQNGNFWPQNQEEWEAFGQIMAPLLGEIVLAFIPGSDIIELYRGINSGDAVGIAFATGGLIVDVAGLGVIKGAIKGAKIVRKVIIIYRKLGRVLKSAAKAIKRGFKVTLDAAGKLILEKGGKIIARGDDAVKGLLRKLDGLTDAQLNKFDDLVEEAARKGQKWDNPEAVADALRKVSDEGVDGVSLSHKKFPAPADGSDSFTLKNAKQYQAEASGDAALSFDKAGVSFDNIADGKLIDRKFGHSSVFDSAGNVANDARARSILSQARRQLGAASGNPIRWEISSSGGANGIRNLFRRNGINIEVIHLPQITIIP